MFLLLLVVTRFSGGVPAVLGQVAVLLAVIALGALLGALVPGVARLVAIVAIAGESAQIVDRGAVGLIVRGRSLLLLLLRTVFGFGRGHGGCLRAMLGLHGLALTQFSVNGGGHCFLEIRGDIVTLSLLPFAILPSFLHGVMINPSVGDVLSHGEEGGVLVGGKGRRECGRTGQLGHVVIACVTQEQGLLPVSQLGTARLQS